MVSHGQQQSIQHFISAAGNHLSAVAPREWWVLSEGQSPASGHVTNIINTTLHPSSLGSILILIFIEHDY